ncbi:NADAR family protein [Variovorax paradoxus]|uniref:Swarming motility protein YbiA n=1 Tax=Variovorax paradoxus TaxID=34073 RepID=A0A0H2M1T1_VARPD|nr:NADAR family protein [Variovorax paradoxus]KLN54692.1 swarming motility protein YbiA [Variovorax paradoxus]
MLITRPFTIAELRKRLEDFARRHFAPSDLSVDRGLIAEAIRRLPAEPSDAETFLRNALDQIAALDSYGPVAGRIARAALMGIRYSRSTQPQPETAAEHHGLDNASRVCFYEQDFYVLSNFSSFRLLWEGINFDTSEAAYHWEKFASEDGDPVRNAIALQIIEAPSAHEAFKIAEQNRALRRPDWDDVKVEIMCNILRAKVAQHEYVRRKLLATGDRELVENSWRDDYWGWGPNRDGKNMLGRLWMEIRAHLRAAEGCDA